MKSYQVTELGAPLVPIVTDTPRPQGTEVLLRVKACGVCHSDIHLWDGGFDLGGGKWLSLQDRGMKLPLVLGHEPVGEVVAMGAQATGVSVGETRLVFRRNGSRVSDWSPGVRSGPAGPRWYRAGRGRPSPPG